MTESLKLTNALHKYFSFLNKLEKDFVHPQKEPTKRFWKSASLRHNTITLSLHTKSEDQKENMAALYLKASFEIKEQTITPGNLYAEQEDVKNGIVEYISTNAPKGFDTLSVTAESILNEEVISYLNMADEIAKQAYLCSSGDNYHPGYYSEIILEETQIILKQTNHWNARSINHKNDYHMRNLEFYIPLNENELETSFRDEKLGRMVIHFSDNSTRNNKGGGDRIFEKINEERLKLKSGNI